MAAVEILLQQSFKVYGDTGVFLTSVEIFFAEVDTNDIPVILQLRTMENGIPTETILPFSEVTIEPSQITTSANGGIGTRIYFDAPVYVEQQTEYAIVLVSASTKYKVWISRVGENDLLTDQFVSTQPDLGFILQVSERIYMGTKSVGRSQVCSEQSKI